jgi:hypothetical protein
MSILRACADRRVVAFLVAVGAAVAVLAPNLIAAAVPFLVVAACPLSMLVMMRMMGGQGSGPNQESGLGAGDGASRLRERLAAVRLEQDKLERELVRLETADRGGASETRIKTTAGEV